MIQPWQTPEAIAAALREPRVYGKSYRCLIEGCRRKGEPMNWPQMQRHVKRAHKKAEEAAKPSEAKPTRASGRVRNA